MIRSSTRRFLIGLAVYLGATAEVFLLAVERDPRYLLAGAGLVALTGLGTFLSLQSGRTS